MTQCSGLFYIEWPIKKKNYLFVQNNLNNWMGTRIHLQKVWIYQTPKLGHFTATSLKNMAGRVGGQQVCYIPSEINVWGSVVRVKNNFASHMWLLVSFSHRLIPWTLLKDIKGVFQLSQVSPIESMDEFHQKAWTLSAFISSEHFSSLDHHSPTGWNWCYGVFGHLDFYCQHLQVGLRQTGCKNVLTKFQSS